MPEGYVNVLFQKGLILDDIIKLLNIEKFNFQKPEGEFLNIVGNRVVPLYVLTDNNGKNYYI